MKSSELTILKMQSYLASFAELAVTVTVPERLNVTSPLEWTVAMLVLLLVHYFTVTGQVV